MTSLATLNGITATIVACLATGMSPDRIASKVAAKYGIGEGAALSLVEAVSAIA